MRQELLFSEHGWGGKRKGAGAKPKPGAGVPHDARERFTSLPVHVTLKLVRNLNGLRHARESALVRSALRAASESPACRGVRWIHYSIQWDHVHMIVEATSDVELAAAMKSLCVRLAKALNKLWNLRGRVFKDRYHAQVLESPHQVRQALRYVLCNDRKHRVRIVPGPDPLSSGGAFSEWLDVDASTAQQDPCVQPARHWLVREGWYLHHPRFATTDIPESRERTASDRKRERGLRRRRS